MDTSDIRTFCETWKGAEDKSIKRVAGKGVTFWTCYVGPKLVTSFLHKETACLWLNL